MSYDVAVPVFPSSPVAVHVSVAEVCVVDVTVRSVIASGGVVSEIVPGHWQSAVHNWPLAHGEPGGSHCSLPSRSPFPHVAGVVVGAQQMPWAQVLDVSCCSFAAHSSLHCAGP